MPFKKGQSGNPGGRVQDKPWCDAIRRAAFSNDPQGVKRLFKIAEACVTAAENGDMAAIKEVGDRLDGKPAQDTNVTIEKRDATDWSLAELVDFIRERRADGGRASSSGGRSTEPDQVH